MALDGITVSNLAYELNEVLSGSRINKIAQPENDELLITFKTGTGQRRLLLSVNASLPLAYFTGANKPSPMTAPNFCMLLRKYLNSGRIIEVTQPGLERILNFRIEHLDELGDPREKLLIVELMGKHSNIIFCDENNRILDSIKHVSAHMSSVREVLPGREYFIPETTHKLNPLDVSFEDFCKEVYTKPQPLSKALYTSLTGISPVIAEELCCRTGVDSDKPAGVLDEGERLHLFHNLEWLIEDVKEHRFIPNIIYLGAEPVEYASVTLSQYEDYGVKTFPSVCEVLETYYSSKNALTRIRQKSADLRRIVQTALERNRKKYDLQLKQLKDTEKRDKYRVYGELINTYGYQLEDGSRTLTALNYYNNETIHIPMDPELSPGQNAKRYFDRYNKLKRTYEALSGLIKETQDEIIHLESVAASLDIAQGEGDLLQIKEELIEAGYIRRRFLKKKVKITSSPFHYLSSDGFHIYVGKNNLQNDELTFKLASGNDWWFHAKGIPGSHVIVKTEGKDLPDRTFEEAGRLAAYYSRGKGSDKVEVDYIQKKHVKKPNGGKPGFVVYYTNYSLMIDSDITGIERLE